MPSAGSSGSARHVQGGPSEATGGADSLTENRVTQPGELGFIANSLLEIRSRAYLYKMLTDAHSPVNPSRTTTTIQPNANIYDKSRHAARLLRSPSRPSASVTGSSGAEWEASCCTWALPEFAGEDIQGIKVSTRNSVFDSKNPAHPANHAW